MNSQPSMPLSGEAEAKKSACEQTMRQVIPPPSEKPITWAFLGLVTSAVAASDTNAKTDGTSVAWFHEGGVPAAFGCTTT